MKKFLSIMLSVLIFASLFTGCGEDTKTQTSWLASKLSGVDYIDMVSCGDNLYHMTVIDSGKQSDGSYNYSDIYSELQSMVSDADLSTVCQETVFAGEDEEFSGYPTFNTPQQAGDALAETGFDVILHATNHTLDKHGSGVLSTLDFWKKYPEISVLGIHETKEDYDTVKIIEVKGVKIALLNYTYGTNGIPVPEDKSYIVELIDEDKIKKDVLFAEENADFTIAFMHWGTEYSITPDDDQRSLAGNMSLWGTDLIIGSHPHVIEPVEWITADNGNKTLVYYSLGNFVSRQLEAINLLGGVAKIKLKIEDGSVSIDEHAFLPIVTHYNQNATKFKIYPLTEYSNKLAAEHGVADHDGAVSVERFTEMVNQVFDGYDKSIIEY